MRYYFGVFMNLNLKHFVPFAKKGLKHLQNSINFS